MPNIDQPIRIRAGFCRCNAHWTRNEAEFARYEAERLKRNGERSRMYRENRRKLKFTFYFIDDESRPRFHCCFMLTASSGTIVLHFGKFICVTGGTLVRAAAVYAPVGASAFQITVSRRLE